MNKNNTICKVCNKELPKKGLGRHLKKHNILPKEYYDKYFKQENEGICPTCGKPTNFNSISTGYHKFCSISCSRQFWTKNKEFNKKAGEKISQSWHNKSQEEKDKIIEQRVTTFNKRSQEWIKQNCSKAGKAKWTKLTKEEKNIEIQKLSNRRKIWWNNLSEKEKQEIINKQKESLKVFYKNESSEHKEKRLEQIKNIWANKSDEELEEYSILQSKLQKDHWKNISEEEYNNRSKKATENNYNWWKNASDEEIKKRCDNMSKGCKHRKYTKNKISKNEQDFINFLDSLHIKYIFQHIEDRYPFHVDFYIPSLDLFIELNIHWHHGKQPYIESSIDCKNQLNIWNIKSRSSQNYRNAINTWTKRDPKKRNTAKKNNLNYIECFNENDIIQLKNQLKEITNGV